ncbi:MAG: replication-associated recombination protein A [Alphaproteobacteria bacterium]|nr:replication-associated recombination protein A [Alphaproteobacteria bacterium]NCQ88824.1 replication-associated recombination protein A [Alphaproteobacteria bacterium]NCT07253.1 replication-associated recombination protein A [Alphaproteobacteria bacterium]
MSNPSTLFDTVNFESSAPRPLADLLRPQSFDDVTGQDHLLGSSGILKNMIDSGTLSSLVFWGPPGCGKTTMARILAQHSDYHFEQLSAIFSGVGDLKKVFEAAKFRRQAGQGTLLFVDEIHRFNKSQQDAFLPVMEDGTITLIGATTENPSFELNAALLSRCQVLVLKRLDDRALDDLLNRAEEKLGTHLPLDEAARDTLKALADGDGRYFLSMVENIHAQTKASTSPLTSDQLLSLIQKRAPIYDKSDDSHYQMISALHKSVRGSDVNAALYWFARMLTGGEDPKFLARRFSRMAVEDIGLADPHALVQCETAWKTYERLGSPEGELALAQALIYLATAPKSNAGYTAFNHAMDMAKKTGSVKPPMHILNACNSKMKEWGFGEGYEYDHDTAEGFSGQNYFPDDMQRISFYNPPERGFERDIKKRLEYWDKLRTKKNS